MADDDRIGCSVTVDTPEVDEVAKDPYMPLYVNDWLSSPRVACMSLEQQGAFVRLLCYCWASGTASIPNDDKVLARLSGLGEGWLANGSQLVRDCFVNHPDGSGNLTNSKLFELWKERVEWREKSVAAGVKSGKARRKASKDKGKGNEPPLPNGSNQTRTKREPKGNSSSSSSSSTTSPNGEVVNTSASPSEAVQKRPRDLLFDSIAEATGLDPATSGGLIAKVRKALAGAEPPYAPEDVRSFARDFWRHCPYAARDGRERPTPNEIEKNIGLVRAPPAPRQHAPQNGPLSKGEIQDNYAARMLQGINERDEANEINFSGLPAARDHRPAIRGRTAPQ